MPDRQQGGFWALAQRWDEEDGVELVLLRFDHEGARVGDPARVGLGETWRTAWPGANFATVPAEAANCGTRTLRPW